MICPSLKPHIIYPYIMPILCFFFFYVHEYQFNVLIYNDEDLVIDTLASNKFMKLLGKSGFIYIIKESVMNK